MNLKEIIISENKKVGKKNKASNQMKKSPPSEVSRSAKPMENIEYVDTTESIVSEYFGAEASDNSWAERLKEVNPAAYENLRNWD